MNLRKGICASFVILSLSLTAWAGPQHEPKAMPKDFETLKPLVGTWEGTFKMGDKEDAAKVVYELTSGGTVITEKMNPGTPMEMITVYHREGKTIGLTHYCAMGNQPRMKLKSADGKVMSFEMAGKAGIDDAKEMHMHAMKLTLADPNTLTQEWTHYMHGKSAGTALINLKRKN